MNRSALWRSFRLATWLGWQIESNWTDPFLFAIYSIIKPITGAAILVIMYGVITQGRFEDPMFPYLYLGNAFYIYVGSIMTGVSWAVIDDREHYRTLKYVYVAPIHIPLYLLGRGVARFLTGSIAVVITIAAGVLFLSVPLDFSAIQWGLFLPTLLFGVFMLTMMGLLLAGLTLIMARHEFIIGEVTASALYIFSGAAFPLEVLPPWLRPIGFAMPTTYWLELLRRSLVSDVAQAFPTLSILSNAQLLSILIGLGVLFAALGALIFWFCDRLARERGLIDITTHY